MMLAYFAGSVATLVLALVDALTCPPIESPREMRWVLALVAVVALLWPVSLVFWIIGIMERGERR